jgi:hypothetical protein
LHCDASAGTRVGILPELVYTDHAEYRLAQRGITKTDVEVALNRPIEILPGEPGTHWVVGYAPEGRILEVCVRANDEASVITAAWEHGGGWG